MYHYIQFEKVPNGIVTISLNRPEVYNSLNEDICSELITAFENCRIDPDIRVVIFTGNGKGFCAGQDLKDLLRDKELKPSEVIRKSYNPLILAMRSLPKPIICKLNGVAAGAGCSLALACDLIVASEEAVMVEAFIGIGLVPDSGSSYFLPKLTGRLKAFELLSLGTKLSAREAEKLGLLNMVVESVKLDSIVSALAMRYLQSPLLAVGLIKEMINNSYRINILEALESEAINQDIAAATYDFAEGINAFKEKRLPVFKGH